MSAEHFTNMARKAVTGTAATPCLSDLSTQETTNGAVLLYELVLSFEALPAGKWLHFLWNKTSDGRRMRYER